MKPKIDDDNFLEYFHPANEDYVPKKGECLARWRARADFVDDYIKRNVIDLLISNESGAEMAVALMVKMVHAVEKDAIRVLREMAEDLLSGMMIDEVAEKPYRLTIEQLYWAKKECVPDDIHWELITTTDLRFIENPLIKAPKNDMVQT